MKKYLPKISIAIGFITIVLVLAYSDAPYEEFKIELEPSLGAIASAQTNNGLVGYWSFEDATGTQATDFSGTGNTGTLDGNPSWITGKQGKALNFDGTGDSVDIPYNSSLNLTGDLTISSWIKASALTDTGGGGLRIVSHWNPTQQYLTAFMDDGQLRFAARGSGYTNGGIVDSFSTITLNTWHHFVAVKSGTVLSVYIDGQLANYQDIGITTLNSSTDNISIGEESVGGGLNFNGQIDEVRLYNRALTAAEVATLYGSTAAARINAPNDFGLVGYWNFEDATGTQATDGSGNGNTGTLNGNTTWTNGKRGKALSFDGSGDYASSSAPVTALPITMCTWFKTSDGSGGETIMSLGAGDGGHYVDIRHNSPQVVSLFLKQGSSQEHAGSVSFALNTWNHVCGLFGTSTMQIYLNGVADGGSSGHSLAPAGIIEANLGRLSGVGLDFTGSVDEARIYNRLLTATEISALYSSGAIRVNAPNNNGLVGYWSMEDATGTQATDFSGNGNTGTLNGNPVWSGGKYGKAISLDGTGDFVNIPDSDLLDVTTAFSVSFWVYVKTTGFHDFVTKGVSQLSTSSWSFIYQSDDALKFFVGNNGTTLFNPVLVGGWHHIVGTFDSSLGSNQIKVYLDNATQYSVRTGTRSSSTVVTTEPVRIGASSDGSRDADSIIDEVRIYNRALSAQEISDLYNTAR